MTSVEKRYRHDTQRNSASRSPTPAMAKGRPCARMQTQEPPAIGENGVCCQGLLPCCLECSLVVHQAAQAPQSAAPSLPTCALSTTLPLATTSGIHICRHMRAPAG